MIYPPNTYNLNYTKEAALAYLRSEGIDQLIDLEPSGGAIPPDVADLARIHGLVRKRKCFTVLEFGVGYSTVVIADALHKNKKEWMAKEHPPKIRNRFMFHCFTVDTSEEWIEVAKQRMPAELKEYVTISYSRVKAGTFQGQLCHFYEELPDVIADFIYLDGPDPKAVEGKVNGLSFQCDERTVMAADLLLMEPTLLPGTFIIVDGRTNNVRFLKNNFRRNFDFTWHREADVSTFELNEERLGKYNLLGSDYI